MRDDDRAIGRLEEAVSTLKDDVAYIRADVKTLLTWRWKLWGVTAIISVVCTAVFELFVAVIEHGK